MELNKRQKYKFRKEMGRTRTLVTQATLSKKKTEEFTHVGQKKEKKGEIRAELKKEKRRKTRYQVSGTI